MEAPVSRGNNTSALQEEIKATFVQMEHTAAQGKHMDVSSMLRQACKVIALLQRLAGNYERHNVQEVAKFIEENTQARKATYGGAMGWTVTFLEIGVEIASVGLALSPLLIPSWKDISAAATPLSTLGQSTGKIKAMADESRNAERMFLESLSEKLKNMRSDSDQSLQRAQQSCSEAVRSAKEADNSRHEAVTATVRA